MIEMAERMHASLTDALELILAILPDGRWEQREGYCVLIAPSFPVPIANSVWMNGPDERQAVSDLASSLEAIRDAGVSPGVLTRDKRFPATEAEARRLGLTAVERMPGMVVTPDRFHPPSGHGPILVRAGEDAELLAVAKDITIRGFEATPEVFDGLFATGLHTDGLDQWLAYAYGQPVSAAVGVVRGDAVGVFDVATPPEHRRKGYGRWVTAQAVRAGFEAGATLAYLQSSDMGLGVYRALGFEQVCEYRLLVSPH